MAEDPYAVMGLSPSATGEEIRRRYRQLAKELHPDVNPSTTAQERFKSVTRAFDILGDTDKRRAYDRGEITAEGEPRYAAHRGRPGAAGPADWHFGTKSFADADPYGEIFSGFRKTASEPGPRARARDRRGQDRRYTLEIDLEDVANGPVRRVTLPGGGVLDIAIPVGVREGQVLRLKGKGEPDPQSKMAGDALIDITVRPHPKFERHGNNLSCVAAIDLDDAILGGKIELATLTGRVSVAIPKGTSSGRIFRLKGQGLPDVESGQRGDLLVTVQIMLPDDIDDELRCLMEHWRRKKQLGGV